jgi:uncharacterized membrane protein YfcA
MSGMTFQVLLQACNRIDSDICDGNVATATLSLTIALIFTSPIQLYVLQQYVDWKLALNLSACQGIGVFLGVNLLMLNIGVTLPRFLGGLLYVVLLQKVLADVYAAVTDPFVSAVPMKNYVFASWLNYVTVWATGISSGLLSGAD